MPHVDGTEVVVGVRCEACESEWRDVFTRLGEAKCTT
jgi:hypothetical protein